MYQKLIDIDRQSLISTPENNYKSNKNFLSLLKMHCRMLFNIHMALCITSIFIWSTFFFYKQTDIKYFIWFTSYKERDSGQLNGYLKENGANGEGRKGNYK